MDATTASFLQDTLRGYTPTAPALPDYYTYLKHGFDVANQLDEEQAAATHQAAANQALLTAKQQYDYTAQTNPYNAALLQEKVALLPMDRKYSQSIQAADADQRRAHADYWRAKANAAVNPADPGAGATMTPFISPLSNRAASGDDAPAGDSSAPDAPAAATPSDDAFRHKTLDDFGAGTTLTPDASNAEQYPLLGYNTLSIPGTQSAGAPSIPGAAASFDPDAPLVQVSGASDPATATVWKNGARVRSVPQPAGGDTSDLPVPDADDAGSDDPMGVLTNYGGRYPRSDASGVIDTGTTLPSGTPILIGANNAQAEPSDDGTDGGLPAASGGGDGLAGFIVPKTEEERRIQRNAWEAHRQQELARPLPRQQKQLLISQIALSDRGLLQAEREFAQNRRFTQAQQKPQGRASGTATTGVLSNDKPPERDGYELRPTGYIDGKQHWVYVPDDELQAKKTAAVDTLVKGATGGADVSDLLSDRGNYRDGTPTIPGGAVPGTHFFMRNTPSGPVEASVPEPVYARLRSLTDPLYYGAPYAPPTAAPAATPPTPGGRAPVTPMHLDLSGRMIPGAGSSLPPPVPPAPAVSNQDRKAQTMGVDAVNVGLPDEDDVRATIENSSRDAQTRKATQDVQDRANAIAEHAQRSSDSLADKLKTAGVAFDPQMNMARSNLENAQKGLTSIQADKDADPDEVSIYQQRLAQHYKNLQRLTALKSIATNPDNYVLAPNGEYTLRPEFADEGIPTEFATSYGGKKLAVTRNF